MPSNKLPRSVAETAVVILCLQLSLLTTTVHCAPTQTQLTANNNNIHRSEAPIEPPLDFPQSAEDAKPADAPPLVFPSNGVDVDVRQADGVAPPPSEFPTDRANVIRVGTDAQDRHGENWTEPPLEFPTNRSLYTIIRPTDRKISETLSKLKNLKEAIFKQHNPKDDAVQLEVNGVHKQNPLQPEEQYGSQTNNLVAMSELTSDDSIVLDRPHESATRNVLVSASLTVSVLGACVLLGILVWRKYVQQKYGQRERLLTEEDGFNGWTQQP